MSQIAVLMTTLWAVPGDERSREEQTASAAYAVPVGWPRFAARIGAEAGRFIADRIAGRDGTPRRPDDITLPWLRRTLIGGQRVRGFEILGHHEGTAQHVLIGLHGNDVPATVFAKLTPTRPAERIFHTAMGLGATEERIYRELGALWPEIMPAYLGSSRDDALGRIALVIEDLRESVRFGDVEKGCRIEEAAQVAVALASVHRPMWRQTNYFKTALSWLAQPNRRTLQYGRRIAYAALRRIPDRGRVQIPKPARIAAALGGCTMTLIHCDTHCGNMGFGPAGVKLFDWQVACKGPALQDLSYFCITSLDTETRRAHERDLLRAYLRALREPITEDEAWRQYRVTAVQAYLAAAVTVVFGARLQPEAIGQTALERAVAALSDLDTVEAITAAG
jgi:hypothetical protein